MDVVCRVFYLRLSVTVKNEFDLHFKEKNLTADFVTERRRYFG